MKIDAKAVTSLAALRTEAEGEIRAAARSPAAG